VVAVLADAVQSKGHVHSQPRRLKRNSWKKLMTGG